MIKILSSSSLENTPVKEKEQSKLVTFRDDVDLKTSEKYAGF